MSFADIIILIIIAFGFLVGFKRGLTRQLVSSIGFFAVVILAFILKNPVSVFLYEHLPFFGFAGIIKGVTVLNIAIYEVIAFFAVLAILLIILKVVIFASKVFEGLLKVTVILSIPSSIGGGIVGLIESYIWVFLILYILNLPMFNISILNDSKWKNNILNKTPFLSDFISDTTNVLDEFTSLREKYEISPNASSFNRETLDLFLKYDVITVKSVERLVEKDKLKIDNIDEILNKYRED